MKIRQYTLVLVMLAAISISACRKKPTDNPATNNPDTTETPTNWQLHGNPIEAKNPNAYATMVIDNNGTEYVLFADGNYDNKATVMKLVNNTWSAVGLPGFSNGKVFKPAMAVNPATGKLYVTYVETSTIGTNKVNVMQFDGQNWAPTGSTNFQSNSVATASISLDDNGHPVIGYVAPPYTGIVMQYDGAVWSNIFTSAPAKRVYDIDYVASSHHMAYLWDTAIGVTHLDVLKNTAGTWSNLGFPSTSSPSSYNLTSHAGKPYLAIEGKGPIRQASVMGYNGSWANIGSTNISAGVAANPTIVISTDSLNTPYLSYKDGSDKPVIMSYSDTWNNVGIKFPDGKVSYVSHVVNPVDKTLYVVLSNADGTISVLKYKKT